MAFDEPTAERVRRILVGQGQVTEKRMFGGLAFMVDDHMCCGVLNDRIMARVGQEQYAQALSKPHASEMDFTGRPLTGFLYVAAEGLAEEDDLEEWMDRCLQFVRSLPPKKKKK